MRFLARTGLFLAVILGIHWVAYTVVPESPVQGGLTIPACPTEDSVNCFWDASEQGNGLGQDLWN